MTVGAGLTSIPEAADGQVHRVMAGTGDLDSIPDAVQEQVPRSSTRACDVVCPRVG